MARTTLTLNTASSFINTCTMTAASSDGNKFYNDGHVLIYATSTGSASTITVTTPMTVATLAIADVTVALGASSAQWFGPLPPVVFNQVATDAGMVYLDATNSSDVKFACIQV